MPQTGAQPLPLHTKHSGVTEPAHHPVCSHELGCSRLVQANLCCCTRVPGAHRGVLLLWKMFCLRELPSLSLSLLYLQFFSSEQPFLNEEGLVAWTSLPPYCVCPAVPMAQPGSPFLPLQACGCEFCPCPSSAARHKDPHGRPRPCLHFGCTVLLEGCSGTPASQGHRAPHQPPCSLAPHPPSVTSPPCPYLSMPL